MTFVAGKIKVKDKEGEDQQIKKKKDLTESELS